MADRQRKLVQVRFSFKYRQGMLQNVRPAIYLIPNLQTRSSWSLVDAGLHDDTARRRLVSRGLFRAETVPIQAQRRVIRVSSSIYPSSSPLCHNSPL